MTRKAKKAAAAAAARASSDPAAAKKPTLLEMVTAMHAIVVLGQRPPGAPPPGGGLMGDTPENQPYRPPPGPPATGRDRAAAAYWDGRPSYIRALRDIKDPVERQKKADEFARNGITIDPAIEVLLADPVAVMIARIEGGWVWVPAVGQAVPPVVPRAHVPGKPDYDPLHPPVGPYGVKAVISTLAFTDGIEGWDNPLS